MPGAVWPLGAMHSEGRLLTSEAAAACAFRSFTRLPAISFTACACEALQYLGESTLARAAHVLHVLWVIEDLMAAAPSALQAAEPGMAAYREPRYTDQDDDVFQVVVSFGVLLGVLRHPVVAVPQPVCRGNLISAACSHADMCCPSLHAVMGFAHWGLSVPIISARP